ncbi:hypothetical protein [Chroococcidiopsis sp. CCMEE 29]|uniref:hypothetical protein n=1 Tax=Chroococcidiopsis sp. CCMEE 29 TaxID=155894 RepID=UPI002021489E|nr:hypothetical protein [Chroococcidiopsis sp. CCMEE 29]
MMSYEQQYFDNEYQFRQDDALLEMMADAASDGFHGKDLESNDPDYLQAYYQGKQRRIALLLDETERMLGVVKTTLGTQESRLATLTQELAGLMDEEEF